MALQAFFGRTRELQRYQKFTAKETPWVLILRGLGGSGKSTFLTEIEKQESLRSFDTCTVFLDFATKSFRDDYLALLENFSQQVESHCDAEQTVNFRKSVASGRYEIGKRISSGKTEIGEIYQGITAGNDAEIKSIESTINITEANIRETRHQMREISKEKFYAQMKTFSKKRLIILLDTCEWLNEQKGAEAGQWLVDELLPWLHTSMQRKGQSCFVIIASRIPLNLNCIKDKEQDKLKLDMLEKADIYQCLEQMETQDINIKDYIYNMTYGHPHSISIIYDLWEEYWGKPLVVANLPRLRDLFYERAMREVIDADILQRLLHSPLDELTHYGSLLWHFNLPLLEAVFKEWLPEAEARERFEQLKLYPHVEYVESLGNFNYMFHRLLREILADYIRVQEPDKWRYYHRLALDFLSSAPLPTENSPDWYYHQLALDETQGVLYWNEIKNKQSQEYLDALREVARDRTLKLTLTTLQCMDIQRDSTGNII